MRAEPLHSGVTMLLLAACAAILAWPDVARIALASLGHSGQEAFAPQRLISLAWSHSVIALLAVVPATVIGIGFGILVTRRAGRPLRPMADALVAASQAVPPVVVVALAFPALGFGAAPTVLALVIYCVMPILRGTAAALDSASGDVAEAARAMGMTPFQALLQVELPLALPVVAGAVRIASILAIATAAVGALAGAATLGTPIIIGLQNQNEVYIVQGAAATGALAFLADGLLLLMLRGLRRSTPLAETAHPPE